MILGIAARIKNEVLYKYIPNLISEAVLDNISLSVNQKPVTPIKSLRTLEIKGLHWGARQNFSCQFSMRTNQTIADTYFKKILADMQKLTGKVYQGIISDSTYYPICISSAGWSQSEGNAAVYDITFEYFNTSSSIIELEPFVNDTIYELDSEVNISLEQTKTGISSQKYNLSSEYEILRTLGGYAGIRYNLFNLTQSLSIFDGEPVYMYDDYLDSNTAKIFSPTISHLNKSYRTISYTKQGLLLPENNLTTTTSIGVFS